MNQYHADGYPELYRLSNLDRNGNPSGHHPDRGTLAWHTDGSWQRVTGQATIIYGEVMPQSGGETHFCDMYCAYERLSPSWKKRIAGLRAVHNLDFSRNRRHGEDPLTDAQRLARPPVDHPIVRTHPQTGRKCLFLGDHAEYVLGLPYDEGRGLIEELNALAVHADLTYEHRWKARELLVWDNRCVMHRATPYDAAAQGRVIRRCTARCSCRSRRADHRAPKPRSACPSRPGCGLPRRAATARAAPCRSRGTSSRRRPRRRCGFRGRTSDIRAPTCSPPRRGSGCRPSRTSSGPCARR